MWGGLLVACAVLVTLVTTAGSAPDGRVRVLQMNLCNSGLAGCYTGRAVATAVEVIRAQTPDVVTLNEVCRADVAVLERALGAGTSAFRPAMDRRTGEAVRCVDGEPYGIAVLTRRPATLTTGGIYPTQNPADTEQRAWLCLDTTAFAACTTHLDNGDAAVARAQCDYLHVVVSPQFSITAERRIDMQATTDHPGLLVTLAPLQPWTAAAASVV